MRSPWQLIKSLTSRLKAKDSSEPVDEVVPTPAPLRQEVARDNVLQAGRDAALDSIPAIPVPVDDNEASEQANSAEAETSEPDPVVRADPLPSDHVADEASDQYDQPLPAAHAIQAAERAQSASASETEPKEQHASVVQAQKAVTKLTVVKKAAQRLDVTKKTVLEETIELDREISVLRSQLSAKLIEQNGQLRRMLERYHDK